MAWKLHTWRKQAAYGTNVNRFWVTDAARRSFINERENFCPCGEKLASTVPHRDDVCSIKSFSHQHGISLSPRNTPPPFFPAVRKNKGKLSIVRINNSVLFSLQAKRSGKYIQYIIHRIKLSGPKYTCAKTGTAICRTVQVAKSKQQVYGRPNTNALKRTASFTRRDESLRSAS